MELKELPIKYEEALKVQSGEVMIDMSTLNFKCENDKQKRAAFIMLRNFYIKENIIFDNCSYDDKAEYLNLYLRGDIVLDIESLNNTWIDIMLIRKGIDHKYDDNILSDEEITLFIEENSKFIDEIINLSVSLPVAGINYYAKNNKNGIEINMDEFESDDFDDINIINYINIIQSPEFIFLIDPNDKYYPRYYTKYFDNKDHEILNGLIHYLPFLNYMNLLFNPGNDIKVSEFINSIENSLSIDNSCQ